MKSSTHVFSLFNFEKYPKCRKQDNHQPKLLSPIGFQKSLQLSPSMTATYLAQHFYQRVLYGLLGQLFNDSPVTLNARLQPHKIMAVINTKKLLGKEKQA